jgi:hypothetical protein
MVISYNTNLDQEINLIEGYEHKTIFVSDVERTLNNTDEILEKYALTKDRIVELVNKNYGTNYNLENWVNDKEDDLAYFLNETGSNMLNYSSNKIPLKFHLYLGKKGFIVAMEQESCFNAQEVDNKKLKENQGRAFNFYRQSKNKIFFDNPEKAKTVFMVVLI